MLSRSPIAASRPHDSYVEKYAIDEDFKEVYEKLTHGAQLENYCF
jgi:hypothetical protein